MTFKKAIRDRAKLRLALDGPAKSGKTTTALRLAVLLGKAPAVIDSEQGKAALCAGEDWGGTVAEFAHSILHHFSPQEYVARINEAAAAGYDVLVIDGLSPAWDGIGGVLELHDEQEDKSGYYAWRVPTKVHRRMLDTILNYPGHVIVTMRSKQVYAVEQNSAGKGVPRRIGLAPVQRGGIEYEFDVLASMDCDHVCTVTGSRCSAFDGAIGHKPGAEFWKPLIEWLKTGRVTESNIPRIEMVSDRQIAEIRQLWVDLGRTQRVEKAKLFRNFTVDEVHQLTGVQADSVLHGLRAEAAEKKLPSAVATSAAASAQRSGEPSSQVPADGSTLQAALADTKQELGDSQANNPGPIKHAALRNLAVIREDFYALCGLADPTTQLGKEQRREMWTAILGKRGVKSAQELNIPQIQDLTSRLQERVNALAAQARANTPSCAAGGQQAAAAAADKR